MWKNTNIIGVIFFLLSNVMCKSCKCNLDEAIHEGARESPPLDKRQLPEGVEDTGDMFAGNDQNDSASDEVVVATSGYSGLAPVTAPNKTFYSLKDRASQLITEMCPYYKNLPPLDVDKVADVWQVVSFRTSEKVKCFRLHLKKTTELGRKALLTKYSSFNSTINWSECHIELVIMDRRNVSRRHFLQKNSYGMGILENIVVSEDMEDDTKVITLQEEVPDQWMVHDDFLLMRDCDSGDVVVFERVPIQTNVKEMEEALKIFGEGDTQGFVACNNTSATASQSSNVKYHIIS